MATAVNLSVPIQTQGRTRRPQSHLNRLVHRLPSCPKAAERRVQARGSKRELGGGTYDDLLTQFESFREFFIRVNPSPGNGRRRHNLCAGRQVAFPQQKRKEEGILCLLIHSGLQASRSAGNAANVCRGETGGARRL